MIRLYGFRKVVEGDFPMIVSWWNKHGQVPPTRDMMPLESTFLVSSHNVPAAVMTVYLTNGPIAWFDNLVGNPDMPKDLRKDAVDYLVKIAEEFSLTEGKKFCFCLSKERKTARRYQGMGYRTTLENVTTLVKEIG